MLVDLLAPDFTSPAEVQTMLRSVASSLSKRVEVPTTNIFINHREAYSGRVFDEGHIVCW